MSWGTPLARPADPGRVLAAAVHRFLDHPTTGRQADLADALDEYLTAADVPRAALLAAVNR